MKPKSKPALYYDEDDEYSADIVPDGFGVRVRMNMIDGKPRSVATVFDARNHRPRFAELTDAQQRARAEARDAWIDRTVNAWKMDQKKPEPDEDDQNGDDPDEDGISDQERRQRARDAYVRQLGNAWRQPSRTPTGFAGSVGPNNVGPTAANRVGGAGDARPQLSFDAANELRNSAWLARNKLLEQAWKQKL